jgi:hypothetical protein
MNTASEAVDDNIHMSINPSFLQLLHCCAAETTLSMDNHQITSKYVGTTLIQKPLLEMIDSEM